MTIQRGDIIQIMPHSSVKFSFWGMLAVVDKVTPWGVQADIPDLSLGRTDWNIIPLRLETKDYIKVGRVHHDVCGENYLDSR